MVEFIIGGSKSGKSKFGESEALRLFKESHSLKLYYFATLVVNGIEEEKIVNRHLKQRDGLSFETIEAGEGIDKVIDKIDENSTVLLDSLSTLFSNELFDANNDYKIVNNAYEKVLDDLRKLIDKVKNVIVVSDNVFSNYSLLSDEMEVYLSNLGKLHIDLARISDNVYEVVNGIVTKIK